MKPPLDSRHARVVRVNSKRPKAPTVRVTYAPRPGSIDELADLVLELLEERTQSGRR